MKVLTGLLMLGALLSAAPVARAEELLPPPIGPVTPVAQRESAGFGADVESALDDFTRFQCDLLFFLTPRQGCPTK
ncbi:hypothetical protein [Vulcanococcus sp.]|jgi:hypothetical protein|uniref:hypothetical protein n=1 Tax=Vulcanococcus sp. TaxID=2856995 RepID=UPI003C0C8C84